MSRRRLLLAVTLLDPGRFQDSLPQGARDFLQGNPTLPPTAGRGRGATPGAAPATSPFANLPGVNAATAAEIDRAMREARSALQQADLRGGQTVCTFDWDLKPMTGAPSAP